MKPSAPRRSAHDQPAQPPVNRRERRRAETRQRLYRAALRLFAQRGYLETTVEDITEAADVGKGTFFNYFRTKEHVLANFGDERLAAIERALEKARSGSPLREIREVVLDLAGKSGETPALLRAIFAAHASSEPVRGQLQQRLRTGRRLFAQMFALAQERGEVRRDIPAEKLGRVVHLMFFGAAIGWTMNPDTALREVASDIWDLTSPGMRTPAGGASDRATAGRPALPTDTTNPESSAGTGTSKSTIRN